MTGLPHIDGSTRLYGIIGDPIAQVGSPALFNTRFAVGGLNALFIPLHMPKERFEAAAIGIMSLANLEGIVVTIPFKQCILDYVDVVLPAAKEIGAANAIRRDPALGWVADNFDGTGLVQALLASGTPAIGNRVGLLGAGGAGMAIAFSLAAAGASEVAIFDVDSRRADLLAARVHAKNTACKTRAIAGGFGGYDIIINATPVGMRPGDGLPADLGALGSKVLVVDISVSSGDTLLLRNARAAGCQTLTGRDMLVAQATAIIRFFGLAV